MAGGTIEKIQVILQSMTSKFASGMNIASTRMKRFGKNMNDFGLIMKTPMERFKILNGRMKGMRTVGGRLAQRFRLMTHGLRGFRMEMLGVMFFGMMLQRIFIGFLRPVMEAFGVFDLFRIMLLTLFLPVMEILFPPLLKIMEFFMNLPEPVQKAIGIFTLLGAAIGALLFIIGSFALGLGSLILVFPSIGVAVQGLGAILAGSFAPLLGIVAIVVAVLIGMFLAWKENFLGMKKIVATFIEGIKQWFGGLVKIVTGVFNIIKAILT